MNSSAVGTLKGPSVNVLDRPGHSYHLFTRTIRPQLPSSDVSAENMAPTVEYFC